MQRVAGMIGVFALCFGLVGESAFGAMPHHGSGDDSVVDIVVTELTREPRAVFDSDHDARCVAKAIVRRLGVKRLEALGLDAGRQTPPRLMQPGLVPRDRDEIYSAYDECLDIVRTAIDGYLTEGFTRPEARCIAESLEASGIPRVHLSEAPHGESTIDTEPARTHLDDFLTAAKLACSDWL